MSNLVDILPSEYWSLRVTGDFAAKAAPWDRHYRTAADALTAARAAFAAVEGEVLDVYDYGKERSKREPGNFPMDGVRNKYGTNCRAEFRPVTGTRRLYDYDETTICLAEEYEARIVRDVIDVEERTIDGEVYGRQVPRVELVVDWTQDLEAHVKDAWCGRKGPWRAQVFAEARWHELRWAGTEEAKTE